MVGAISDTAVAMSVSTVLPAGSAPAPAPTATAATPLDPAGLAMTFFASGKPALCLGHVQ